MWTRLSFLPVLVLLLASCQPTPIPTLTISPGNQTIAAGSAPIAFTATLTNSTTPISWSLDPVSGAGTLSSVTGPSTTYTPPASIASTTAVTLTATAGALSRQVTLIVNPAAPTPTLTISPGNQTIAAGSAPIAFAATLTNSTAPISWSLDPVSGAGTLSSVTGPSTTYTPPASIASTTAVTLTATAGALSRQVTLIVNPATDTTAPTVVSVSPANVSTGVLKNTNIVITFSERMNQAATQAAYQSDFVGIRPADVTFSWNSEGTVLTINPIADLYYATGSSTSVVALIYAYTMTNTATDMAGNALTSVSVTFRTMRQLTQDLPGIYDLSGTVTAGGLAGQAACSLNPIVNLNLICPGDNYLNAQFKGFLSFDMTAVPAGAQFTAANLAVFQWRVAGNPYESLGGGLLAEHVNFATMNLAAFTLAPLSTIGVVSNDAYEEVWKNISVLAAVQDDYANRAARGNRSQFRLRFPIASDFDGIDEATLIMPDLGEDGGSKLTVTFLIP